MPVDASATEGLRGAAAQVLASVLDIGRGRLELIAVELEEERLRVARLFIAAACALFLVFLAVVLLAALIVLMCEPPQRPAVLAAILAVVVSGAVACLWRWRRLVSTKPALLEATLGELHRDHEALAGARHA